MLSKACEYAIKALIFVAQKSKENLKIGVKDIAAGTDSPEHFVAKIMQELSRKNLVKSSKGPNGGFYMDDNTMSTSLAEIVEAIDGKKLFVDCVLGLKVCNEKTPCPVHFEYKQIKQNLIKMLESNSIGEFNQKLDTGKYFLKNEINN